MQTVADPPRAFDHIARRFFENHPRWDPMIVAMEKTTDEPVTAGTTGRETRRLPGRRLTNDLRVTEFNPDRRFGFEATSGPLRERMDCTIEPSGPAPKSAFS